VLNIALLGGSKGGIVTPGIAASAFLARTSGLDTTHTNMYTNLINGLVTDGVWSKLDCLYFFATKDTTTALLNLVSSSFAVSNTGCSWVADQGYTGTAGTSGSFLNTTFNPSTAGGNFSQNSAHISVWSNTSLAVSGNKLAGALNSSQTAGCDLAPLYTDGKAYFRTNEPQTSAGVTNAGGTIAHFLQNRSAASGAGSESGYINAVDQGMTPVSSSAMVSFPIYMLSSNRAGAAQLGWGGQISCGSIGGSLTATDVANLKNRLSTARTVVGLP
jgi:hypothetical protein